MLLIRFARLQVTRQACQHLHTSERMIDLIQHCLRLVSIIRKDIIQEMNLLFFKIYESGKDAEKVISAKIMMIGNFL